MRTKVAWGCRLLDVPGWRFQALATRLPGTSHPPPRVWRYYNGRADCENVIKELREGFALPTLCLEKFWSSEAALSLAVLTYNLSVLFQRHLGWQQKVTDPPVALLVVRYGWRVEPSEWKDNRVTGGASTGTGLVEAARKNSSPLPNCT